jgi:hypothetical protein
VHFVNSIGMMISEIWKCNRTNAWLITLGKRLVWMKTDRSFVLLAEQFECGNEKCIELALLQTFPNLGINSLWLVIKAADWFSPPTSVICFTAHDGDFGESWFAGE